MKLFSNSAIVVIVALVIAGEGKVEAKSNVGKFSVVREEESKNKAKGKYCSVSGGKKNSAGPEDAIYSTVSGGKENQSNGNGSSISGGSGNRISHTVGGTEFVNDLYSSISGGVDNLIKTVPKCAISGGNGNIIRDSTGDGGSGGTVSGGSSNVISSGNGNVITGGKDNASTTNSEVRVDDTVITGGKDNEVDEKYAVVIGGVDNAANGKYSIAFGTKAVADTDNSMAVNLTEEDLKTTKKGEFSVQAESFRFQIGNGKKDGSTILFDKKNIKILNDILEKE